MADYQLTVDEDQVAGLFTRDGALAALVERIVQQILEAQVRDYLQAGRYERTEERRGYRNGFKPRSLTTRVGTLELRVPQVREGEFSTDLFVRFQRSEQAFLLALLEMVVQGVSTRKVTKSTVSALRGRGLQEHRLRPVWPAGPPGHRLERTAVERDALSLPPGGRVGAQDPRRGAGARPQRVDRYGHQHHGAPRDPGPRDRGQRE